jgi:hypothetical protein
MTLVERVKRILLSPKTEWQVIEAEPTTPTELYTGYVMPLAAIGPLAQLIGYSVFGVTIPLMGTYRAAFGSAITHAVVMYVLTLAATYAVALIVDALAPTFNGKRSQIQALKLAAYSFTAYWVAGIFALIPVLGFLGVLGLYSLYLLYLGLPVLMKTPRDKALIYTVVVIIATIVLWLVVRTIAGVFMRVPAMGMTVP